MFYLKNSKTIMHPLRLKINVEPENGWFGSDDFRFQKKGVFSGSTLIFRGVQVNKNKAVNR